MDPEELYGVFPLGNPIPYTGRVEQLCADNLPPQLTWYHRTRAENVASIVRLGLIPSCWFGGDCCCVFGVDTLGFAVATDPEEWVIEIRSRAEPGTDLKAWWVPPNRIEGAWHLGHFVSPASLLSIPGRDITQRLGKLCCSDGLCTVQFHTWQQLALPAN